MLESPFVHLYTRDIEAGLRFYRDLLGFKETFRTPTQGVPEHVELTLRGFGLGLGTVEAAKRVHGVDASPGTPPWPWSYGPRTSTKPSRSSQPLAPPSSSHPTTSVSTTATHSCATPMETLSRSWPKWPNPSVVARISSAARLQRPGRCLMCWGMLVETLLARLQKKSCFKVASFPAYWPRLHASREDHTVYIEIRGYRTSI